MQERDVALAAAADAHEALAANYAGLLASAHAAKLGLDAACAHHAPVLAADETRVRHAQLLPLPLRDLRLSTRENKVTGVRTHLSTEIEGCCRAQRALRGARAAMASSLRGLLPAASAASRAGPLESGLGAGSGSDMRAQPPPDASASVSARRPGTPPRAPSACSGRRSVPRPNPGPDAVPSVGRHAGAGRSDRDQGAGVAAGVRGPRRREGDVAPLLSSAGTAGRRRWAPASGRIAMVRPHKHKLLPRLHAT